MATRIKRALALSFIFTISSISHLCAENTPSLTIQQAILTGTTNLVEKSTLWDWLITLGSGYGAAHGLYNGNNDQAIAWSISFLIGLTSQLTRNKLPRSMVRFVAPAILISYRTGALTKLAKQLHGLTNIEALKKAQVFFTENPESCAAVIGIAANLLANS